MYLAGGKGATVVNDVESLDMSGDQLVLYGEDDNIIAAWASGKWDYWKVHTR